VLGGEGLSDAEAGDPPADDHAVHRVGVSAWRPGEGGRRNGRFLGNRAANAGASLGKWVEWAEDRGGGCWAEKKRALDAPEWREVRQGAHGEREEPATTVSVIFLFFLFFLYIYIFFLFLKDFLFIYISSVCYFENK
jgi:hypothetical protein